jgi:hypothetical protein
MNQYPFTIKLLVQRRPHMRDDNLEMVMHMGTRVLRQIFDEMRVDPKLENVVMYFPERWMNIIEERSLWDRLAKYCPNLKSVEIMTQSVYIIQCTRAENVLIVCSEDEVARIAAEGGLTQESSEGRLWYKNVHGFDFSKLTVM